MEELEKIKKIYNAIDEKQGEDITVIKIKGLTSLTDYFIISNGNNPKQVDAICENIKTLVGVPNNIEGIGSSWILMDYNSAFVHIFTKDQRQNYELERLWSDGEIIDMDKL